MRMLFLGILMTWGCILAQVQPPPGAPAQPETPLAEPKPDAQGPYDPGGEVSIPKLIHEVKPHYTKPAKKEKITGHVIVSLVVDDAGKPRDVHVIQGLGYGLDEEAVKAVSGYVFKPSELRGRPVAISMRVDVSFQLF